MSQEAVAPPGDSLFHRHSRASIRLAFAVVYVFWGVSYTVNRIMVLSLPPLLAAGARFALAGAVLAVIAATRRARWPQRPRDWLAVAVAAALGIALANGLSVLALQHVASNQVALINASCALWIAWIGRYGRRASPVGGRTWTGLVLGFAGVALLLSAHGFGADAGIGWQLLVLVATLCWALATAVMREWHPDCDTVVFTACYLLFGGTLLASGGTALGEPSRWTWSATGLAAIAFLAIFSSTCGFIAYTYLLRHETPSRVGTYAYVNPLVAVFTGWLILGERLDARQIAGSIVILAGVILVQGVPLLPRRARPRRAAA